MISDRLVATEVATATRTPRLTMKPDAALGGLVDGAWWPRSPDPAAEFPSLITALGAGGPVHRVSYHLDSWGRADRRLAVGDLVVRMEGFHHTQPDTVTLSRLDHTRVRLLVIPPGTPDDVASAVLRSASTSGATTTVEEILAGNGLTAGAPRAHATTAPRARPPQDEDRWDTEGGAKARTGASTGRRGAGER